MGPAAGESAGWGANNGSNNGSNNNGDNGLPMMNNNNNNNGDNGLPMMNNNNNNTNGGGMDGCALGGGGWGGMDTPVDGPLPDDGPQLSGMPLSHNGLPVNVNQNNVICAPPQSQMNQQQQQQSSPGFTLTGTGAGPAGYVPTLNNVAYSNGQMINPATGKPMNLLERQR